MNGHGSLVVIGGGEHLGLLGGDGGVLLDQRSGDTAHGFDTQGQGRHIQQQHIFHITGQHGGLEGGAYCHSFVGVDVLAGLLAEEIRHLLLYQGHG